MNSVIIRIHVFFFSSPFFSFFSKISLPFMANVDAEGTQMFITWGHGAVLKKSFDLSQLL